MKRAIVGSIALSFVTGVAFAQAQQPAGGATPSPAQGASASVEFSTIDANRDGRLSTAEVQSHSDLKSAFSTLDTDRDSYLSQTEYQKWNKAKSDSMDSSRDSSSTSPSTTSPSTSPSTSPQSDTDTDR